MIDVPLYLVRIWRDPEGSSRASVRRADEDESRCFHTQEELAQFFRAEATAEPEPDGDFTE